MGNAEEGIPGKNNRNDAKKKRLTGSNKVSPAKVKTRSQMKSQNFKNTYVLCEKKYDAEGLKACSLVMTENGGKSLFKKAKTQMTQNLLKMRVGSDKIIDMVSQHTLIVDVVMSMVFFPLKNSLLSW